jgi:hypothetical protein
MIPIRCAALGVARRAGHNFKNTAVQVHEMLLRYGWALRHEVHVAAGRM